MTSIKLFFLLQKHVAEINTLANQLKTEQIDKKTARLEALRKTEELIKELNT